MFYLKKRTSRNNRVGIASHFLFFEICLSFFSLYKIPSSSPGFFGTVLMALSGILKTVLGFVCLFVCVARNSFVFLWVTPSLANCLDSRQNNCCWRFKFHVFTLLSPANKNKTKKTQTLMLMFQIQRSCTPYRCYVCWKSTRRGIRTSTRTLTPLLPFWLSSFSWAWSRFSRIVWASASYSLGSISSHVLRSLLKFTTWVDGNWVS